MILFRLWLQNSIIKGGDKKFPFKMKLYCVYCLVESFKTECLSKQDWRVTEWFGRWGRCRQSVVFWQSFIPICDNWCLFPVFWHMLRHFHMTECHIPYIDWRFESIYKTFVGYVANTSHIYRLFFKLSLWFWRGPALFSILPCIFPSFQKVCSAC